MPWRAGWWCGCDGSGVRWRRATGRRGWRGGGGCGCNSSPIGRWRSRGRRGPSSGRRTRGACGPPGALLPGAQVAAGSSRDPPGARVEAARPRGRGSPSRSRGGVRHDLLEGGRDRAARVTWTGPVLHPDPVRTVRTRRGPRSSSPALVDALGGSAAGALTLRRHRASRRAPPDLAPRPARPPRHRLPGAPGRVAGPRAAPRRVPGLAPAPSPTRSKHPQAAPGRARAPRHQPIPRRLSSSERFPGAGTTPHPFMELSLPPHPGRSSLEPRRSTSW